LASPPSPADSSPGSSPRSARKDLSNRTGETVGNFHSLRNAFQIVGVHAGNVSPILFQIQKALGGISETGEPTDAAFRRLGLDIETLKKLDAPDLSTLAVALGKVDRATASNVASKIAGRGGAGDLLQIARDSHDFAAAFNRLDDTLIELKQTSFPSSCLSLPSCA